MLQWVSIFYKFRCNFNENKLCLLTQFILSIALSITMFIIVLYLYVCYSVYLLSLVLLTDKLLTIYTEHFLLCRHQNFSIFCTFFSCRPLTILQKFSLFYPHNSLQQPKFFPRLQLCLPYNLSYFASIRNCLYIPPFGY